MRACTHVDNFDSDDDPSSDDPTPDGLVPGAIDDNFELGAQQQLGAQPELGAQQEFGVPSDDSNMDAPDLSDEPALADGDGHAVFIEPGAKFFVPIVETTNDDAASDGDTDAETDGPGATLQSHLYNLRTR